ncbi:DeoR/GlpR family DNA-binding transcription regulator [Prolixibacter sp. SD074]|uniref:DeoR/GlpR family DNA-binding transcription regulator n=1 Tax=Prolixibacter sp. SD074 TaxID=2652391 RepID=UPI001281E1ED|nr:DeoR/GlpR family DNA-binding transcription regulator [Prolixibacter sp. SD074]GET29951.1 DeoR family transcriptional regulator [Prolixibacter sp. SD074]
MAISIAERHQYILKKLNENGFVNVMDLSKELEVSFVTIRKDLKALEERNLLFRTHGSATLINPYINEKPVNEKEKIHANEKQKIAKAAITLINNLDTIIIASGTTVIEFARQILNLQYDLTVLSASLDASLILGHYSQIEIIQLGGNIRKSSSSVIGPFAEKMLSEFSCNKLFMGVDGIDLSHGFTTTSAMEASLNQKMITAAQKIIVLADSSKFGRRGFGRICGLDKVDIVITDKSADEKFKKGLEDQGIQVLAV